MRCDANFHSILASHSHFALFHIFRIFAVCFAYFVHFSCTFLNFLVLYLYWPKGWKKVQKECEKCNANAKCKCSAEKVRCNELWQKVRTGIYIYVCGVSDHFLTSMFQCRQRTGYVYRSAYEMKNTFLKWLIDIQPGSKYLKAQSWTINSLGKHLGHRWVVQHTACLPLS